MESKINKKELIVVIILTILIAFMDLTGIPSILFLDIHIEDVNPMYFTLMFNFIFIGIFCFLFLKFFCHNWKLGFKKEGTIDGLKKYGIAGIGALLLTTIAFYIGLKPFDVMPSIWKILIEGFIYYIGVGIIEELYVRGLFLNVLEKMFYKRKNATILAIIISSLIFGIGHIFGTLGQPILVIIIKVIWTICMGMYFGVIYKKTNNLWVPIIMHIVMDFCAIPYCFSSLSGYANTSLYIIFPTYLLLGTYSLYIWKNKKEII